MGLGVKIFSRRPGDHAVLSAWKPPQQIYPRACLTHARKDGSPVLIEDSSWRTVNGVMVSVGKWRICLEFRRFG